MKLLFNAYDELVDIKDLKDSEFQRNIHPEDQIRILAKIMKEDGVSHPICVSKNTGTICFGHGRRDAALKNGWEKFPVVYYEFRDKEHEWRMVQSDNGIAHYAELDKARLNVDIQDFGPFDIELLGIPNFVVEPMDFGPLDGTESKSKEKQCPECGFIF